MSTVRLTLKFEIIFKWHTDATLSVNIQT